MKVLLALTAGLSTLLCVATADAQYPANRAPAQHQANAPRANVRMANLDHGRSYAAAPVADPAMSGGMYNSGYGGGYGGNAGGYAGAPSADCGCNGGGQATGSYVDGGGSCDTSCWPGYDHPLLHKCGFVHSTGDMPQHMAYCPGPHHGYYYFRPYHVMHVFAQQDMVTRWGGDPRHPYENSVFERVYGQLGVYQPAQADVVGQPAPIFRGY